MPLRPWHKNLMKTSTLRASVILYVWCVPHHRLSSSSFIFPFSEQWNRSLADQLSKGAHENWDGSDAFGKILEPVTVQAGFCPTLILFLLFFLKTFWLLFLTSLPYWLMFTASCNGSTLPLQMAHTHSAFTHTWFWFWIWLHSGFSEPWCFLVNQPVFTKV